MSTSRSRKQSGADSQVSKVKSKQKSAITPITKCFGAVQNRENLKSPEYEMAAKQKDQRETRSSAKSKNIHSAVLPCPEEVEIEQFKSLSHEEQQAEVVRVLNCLCQKITEIDVSLNRDTDGMGAKLTNISTTVDKTSSDFEKFKEEYQVAVKSLDKENMARDKSTTELEEENRTLRGILAKFSNQFFFLNEKITALTAKGMENNITITGLEGDIKDEDCKDTVVTFFREKIEIDVDNREIQTAYRMGKQASDEKYRKNRTMLVVCEPDLKERVFKNIKNLKDKKNGKNETYYVNKQLPEALIERNRKNREIIKAVKEKEKALPVDDRTEIELKNKTVFLDGVPAPEYLPKVEIEEMFPTPEEKNKQDKIQLVAANPESKNNSTFMGYATRAGQMADDRRAYRKVKRMHPGVDHVVAVYRIQKHSGYQDDDEIGAGNKLLKALEEKGQKNYAVFVVRLHGRINLGPDRFDIIKKVGHDALNKLFL